jgi:ElaB/YqjD/DUF883 family membrane-anchored ribosome-binding protein
LTKGTKEIMYKVTLLESEAQNLRRSNEALSKRHRAIKNRLQDRGKITIDEAREGVDQTDAYIQVQAESLRSGGRGGLV